MARRTLKTIAQNTKLYLYNLHPILGILHHVSQVLEFIPEPVGGGKVLGLPCPDAGIHQFLDLRG